VATSGEALALAEALRGRVPEYVALLGERDPARYRQFLGWFFTKLEVDGDGHGRGRAVRLSGWLPTDAGAALLGVPEGAWVRPPLMGVPVKQNAQECPWLAPLTLLVPAP
jgi:hypothetical protein